MAFRTRVISFISLEDSRAATGQQGSSLNGDVNPLCLSHPQRHGQTIALAGTALFLGLVWSAAVLLRRFGLTAWSWSGLECGGASPPLWFDGLVLVWSGVRRCFSAALV